MWPERRKKKESEKKKKERGERERGRDEREKVMVVALATIGGASEDKKKRKNGGGGQARLGSRVAWVTVKWWNGRIRRELQGRELQREKKEKKENIEKEVSGVSRRGVGVLVVGRGDCHDFVPFYCPYLSIFLYINNATQVFSVVMSTCLLKREKITMSTLEEWPSQKKL